MAQLALSTSPRAMSATCAASTSACYFATTHPLTVQPRHVILRTDPGTARSLRRAVHSRTGGPVRWRRQPTTASISDNLAAIPGWIAQWIANLTVEPKKKVCPDGMYKDRRTDACVYTCKPGFVWDPVLRRCIPREEPDCLEGYAFDHDLNACSLPDEPDESNGLLAMFKKKEGKQG